MAEIKILSVEERPLSETQKRDLVAFFGHPGRRVLEAIVSGKIASLLAESANDNLNSIEYPKMVATAQESFNQARRLRGFLKDLREFADTPESKTSMFKVTNES